MQFQSMDYFFAAARERSFTKAAEVLHITQQALSAHISSLEAELGCQLFLRRVPLELTYAGEVFLRHAAAFQRLYAAMQHEFADIANHQQGRLRIGIAPTRGRAIMPELVSRFQACYPLVEIQLVESPNDTLPKRLRDGEVDLAVASFSKKMTGISLADFYQEEVALFASTQLLKRLYGSQAEEVVRRIGQGELALLAPCPLLLNSGQEIAGRIGREVIAQAGFQPQVVVRSEKVETLLDLCVRGVGACFCPVNLAQTALTAQQLGRLTILRFGEQARYMIRFGWMEQPYQWHIISQFVELALRGRNGPGHAI